MQQRFDLKRGERGSELRIFSKLHQYSEVAEGRVERRETRAVAVCVRPISRLVIRLFRLLLCKLLLFSCIDLAK
jgi:hypothetical protein